MADIVLSGITGAIVGSFLALAAERYQLSASVREWFTWLFYPASHCAQCFHQLRWRDMIPFISWVNLRGRCRYCSEALPVNLLACELVTALLFTLQAWLLSGVVMQIWIAIYSASLLLLAEIDRRYMLLPDVMTLMLLWLGLLFNCAMGPVSAEQSIIGAIAGYLAFALLAEGWKTFHNSSGLGYGDVKLFAALGAWNGWAVLPQIALIAAISGLSGAAFIFVRCKYTGRTFSSPQPFGPYLAVAGWLVMITQLLNPPSLRF